MDASAKCKNGSCCKKPVRSICALLKTTKTSTDNDDRIRSKVRLPRAMSTIVEENLSSQLRDVHQSVLELLDAAGRRVRRCVSNDTTLVASISPESSTTNSNATTTTSATNPSATSHDIDSITLCSSRKSRSCHFTTSKHSLVAIDVDHPEICRYKRRLRRNTIVSKVLTKKSHSNNELYNPQYSILSTHLEMPCLVHRGKHGSSSSIYRRKKEILYRQPALLTEILRRSAAQNNINIGTKPPVKHVPPENSTLSQAVKQAGQITKIVNNKRKIYFFTKSPEKYKEHAKERDKSHQKSSKNKNRERHKKEKYSLFSPSSSLEDEIYNIQIEKRHRKSEAKRSKEKPKDKPGKSKSPRREHKKNKHMKNEASQFSGLHVSTDPTAEKATSPLRSKLERVLKGSFKEKVNDNKPADRNGCKVREKKKDKKGSKTKESKDSVIHFSNSKSKKRKELIKEEPENCSERKKVKRESSLVRIKQSLLQLARFSKLGEKRRSKSKTRSKTSEKLQPRTSSKDKTTLTKFLMPTSQTFNMDIKVSTHCKMQKFFDQDNADLDKLCSCEPIATDKKAKPTVTRAQLGSLVIPPFKPKNKKRESRGRHRRHNKKNDYITADIGTMPYDDMYPLSDTKVQTEDPYQLTNNLTDGEINVKALGESDHLYSKSSLMVRGTIGSINSSYDSHDTIRICEDISVTSLPDLSNLMAISDFANTEESILVNNEKDLKHLNLAPEDLSGRMQGMKNLLDSLCAPQTFDNCPPFLREPYCYMTLNTTLNKRKIKNKSTNTKNKWTRKDLLIDSYADAIQRAKPHIGQRKTHKTSFKKSYHQKRGASGRHKQRSTDKECSSDNNVSDTQLNRGKNRIKSKIPVFFSDKRILQSKKHFNYSSDASTFIEDKTERKASRIPRRKYKKTIKNISETNIQVDSTTNCNNCSSGNIDLDFDSIALEELSKSKDLLNLEEEVLDIYWNEVENMTDFNAVQKLGENKSKDCINIWNVDKFETSEESKTLSKIKEEESNEANKKSDNTLSSREIYSAGNIAEKTRSKNERSFKTSHHSAPNNSRKTLLSVTRTCLDSFAKASKKCISSSQKKNQNMIEAKSSTPMPSDILSLANITSKDMTQPTNTTTLIVNLTELDDAHMNAFNCNSKALLEDSLRQISSKINLEEAMRQVGNGDKHSVSLQVIVPSKHANTNTSFSHIPKSLPRKKTFHKSKLPLPIDRSKKSVKNSYTFPIEIDLRKIGMGDKSGSDVSGNSVLWESGKWASEWSDSVADNCIVNGETIVNPVCEDKFNMCLGNNVISSKRSSKFWSLHWWRRIFSKKSKKANKEIDVILNFTNFTDILDVSSTYSCQVEKRNMVARSRSLITLSNSRTESVVPILRTLSMDSIHSSNYNTAHFCMNKNALIVQQLEHELNIREELTEIETLVNEEVIAVTDYNQSGSQLDVANLPIAKRNNKNKLPGYKTKKSRCKLACHKSRTKSDKKTKFIFDVPPAPVHHESEFEATRIMIKTAKPAINLEMHHEGKEEVEKRLHEYEERVVEREKLIVFKEDKRKIDKEIKHINQEAEQGRGGYENIYTPITRCDYGMTYFNFQSALRNFMANADTLRILTPCVKGHMQKAPKETPPQEVPPVLIHVGSQTCDQDVTTLVGEYIFPNYEALMAEEINIEEKAELDSKTKDIIELHTQEEFCFEIYPDVSVETEPEPIPEVVSVGSNTTDSCLCCDPSICSSESSAEDEYTMKLILQSEYQEIHVIFKDDEFKIVLPRGSRSFLQYCDCGADEDIERARERFFELLYERLRRNSNFIRKLRSVLVYSMKSLLGVGKYRELSRRFIKDVTKAIISYEDICYFHAVTITIIEIKYRKLCVCEADCPIKERLDTIREEPEPGEQIDAPKKELSEEYTGDEQKENNVVQLEKTSFTDILDLHSCSSCTSLEQKSKATSLSSIKALKHSKSCMCVIEDRNTPETRNKKVGRCCKVDMALGDDGSKELIHSSKKRFNHKRYPRKHKTKKAGSSIELERFYTSDEFIPPPVVEFSYSCSQVVLRHPPILWVLAKKLAKVPKWRKKHGKVGKERPNRNRKVKHDNQSTSESSSWHKSSHEGSSKSCCAKKKKQARPKRETQNSSCMPCSSSSGRNSQCKPRKSSCQRKPKHDDDPDKHHDRHVECFPNRRTNTPGSSKHAGPQCTDDQSAGCCHSRCGKNKKAAQDPIIPNSIQCRVHTPETTHEMMPSSSHATASQNNSSINDFSAIPDDDKENSIDSTRSTHRRHSAPAVFRRKPNSKKTTSDSVTQSNSTQCDASTKDHNLQDCACGPSSPLINASSSMSDDKKKLLAPKDSTTDTLNKGKEHKTVLNNEPTKKTPKCCIKATKRKKPKKNNHKNKNSHPPKSTTAPCCSPKKVTPNCCVKSAPLHSVKVLTTEEVNGENKQERKPEVSKRNTDSDIRVLSTEPAAQSSSKTLSSEHLSPRDKYMLTPGEYTAYPVMTQTTIQQVQPMVSITVLTDETIMMDQESATCSFTDSEIQTLLSFRPINSKRPTWLKKMTTFRKAHKRNHSISFRNYESWLPGIAQTSITLLPTLNISHALFGSKRRHKRFPRKSNDKHRTGNAKKIQEILPAQSMKMSTESLLVHLGTPTSLSRASIHAKPNPAMPEGACLTVSDIDNKEEPLINHSGEIVKLTACAVNSSDSYDLMSIVDDEAEEVENDNTLQVKQECCRLNDTLDPDDDNHLKCRKQVNIEKYTNADDLCLMTVEGLPGSMTKPPIPCSKLDKLYLFAHYVQTDFDMYVHTTKKQSMSNYLRKNSIAPSTRSSVPTVRMFHNSDTSVIDINMAPKCNECKPPAKVAEHSSVTPKNPDHAPPSASNIVRSTSALQLMDQEHVVAPDKIGPKTDSSLQRWNNQEISHNTHANHSSKTNEIMADPYVSKISERIIIISDLNSGKRIEYGNSDKRLMPIQSRVPEGDNVGTGENVIITQTDNPHMVSKLLSTIVDILDQPTKNNANFVDFGTTTGGPAINYADYNRDSNLIEGEGGRRGNLKRSIMFDDQSAQVTLVKQGTKCSQIPRGNNLLECSDGSCLKETQFLPRSASHDFYSDTGNNRASVSNSMQLSNNLLSGGIKRKSGEDEFVPHSAPKRRKHEVKSCCTPETEIISVPTTSKANNSKYVSSRVQTMRRGRNSRNSKLVFAETKNNSCCNLKERTEVNTSTAIHHPKTDTKDKDVETFITKSLAKNQKPCCQQKASKIDKKLSVRPISETKRDSFATRNAKLQTNSPPPLEMQEQCCNPKQVHVTTSPERIKTNVTATSDTKPVRIVQPKERPNSGVNCGFTCEKKKERKRVFPECCDDNIRKDFENQPLRDFVETHSPCCLPNEVIEEAKCATCVRHCNKKKSNNYSTCTSGKNCGWKKCCKKTKKPPNKYIFNECCGADVIKDFYKLGATKFTKRYPECCWPRILPRPSAQVVDTYYDMQPSASNKPAKHEDPAEQQPKSNLKKRFEYVFNDCCNDKTIELFHKLGLENFKNIYPECCWPQIIETDIVAHEMLPPNHTDKDKDKGKNIAQNNSQETSELVRKYEYVLKDCCGDDVKALLTKLGFEEFSKLYPQCCVPEKVVKEEVHKSPKQLDDDNSKNSESTFKKCFFNCKKKQSDSKPNVLTIPDIDEQSPKERNNHMPISEYKFSECCGEDIKEEFSTQGEHEFKKTHPECCWPTRDELRCCERDSAHWHSFLQQYKERPELMATLPGCCIEHVKKLLAESKEKNEVVLMQTNNDFPQNTGKIDYFPTSAGSLPSPSQPSTIENLILAEHPEENEQIRLSNNISLNILPEHTVKKPTAYRKLGGNIGLTEEKLTSDLHPSKLRSCILERTDNKNDNSRNQVKSARTASGENVNSVKPLMGNKNSSKDHISSSNSKNCKIETSNLFHNKVLKETLASPGLVKLRPSSNQTESKYSLLDQIDICFGAPKSVSEPNLMVFESDDYDLFKIRNPKITKGPLRFKIFAPTRHKNPTNILKGIIPFTKFSKPIDSSKKPSTLQTLEPKKQISYVSVKVYDPQIMSIHSRIQVRDDDESSSAQLEEEDEVDGRLTSTEYSDPLTLKSQPHKPMPQDEKNIKFLEEIELIDFKKLRKGKKSSYNGSGTSDSVSRDVSEDESGISTEGSGKINEARNVSSTSISPKQSDPIIAEDTSSPTPESPKAFLADRRSIDSLPQGQQMSIPSSPPRRSSLSSGRYSELLHGTAPPVTPPLSIEKETPRPKPVIRISSASSLKFEVVPTRMSVGHSSTSGMSLKKNKTAMERFVSKFYDNEKPPKEKKSKHNGNIISKLFGEKMLCNIIPKWHKSPRTFKCGCTQARGKPCKCHGQTRYSCQCKQEGPHIIGYSFVDNPIFCSQNKQSMSNLKQTSYCSLFETNSESNDLKSAMNEDYSTGFIDLLGEQQCVIDSKWRLGAGLNEEMIGFGSSVTNSQNKLSTIVEHTEQDHEYEQVIGTSDHGYSIKNRHDIIGVYKRLHPGSRCHFSCLRQSLGNRLPHVLTKTEFNPKLHALSSAIDLERKKSKLDRLIKRIKYSLSRWKVRKTKYNEPSVSNSTENIPNRTYKKDTIRYNHTYKVDKRPDDRRKEEIRIGGTSYLIRAPRALSKSETLNSQRTIGSDIPSLRSYETPKHIDVANNVDLNTTISNFNARKNPIKLNNSDHLLKLQEEIKWIDEKLAGKYREASLKIKQELQKKVSKEPVSSVAISTKPSISEKGTDAVTKKSHCVIKSKQVKVLKESLLNEDDCNNCFSIQSCYCNVQNKVERTLNSSPQEELVEFRELIRRERERIRREDVIRRKQAVCEAMKVSKTSIDEEQNKAVFAIDTCALFRGHTCSKCMLNDAPTRDSSQESVQPKISKSAHLLAHNISSGGEVLLTNMREKHGILSTYVPTVPPAYPAMVRSQISSKINSNGLCNNFNTEDVIVQTQNDIVKAGSSNATSPFPISKVRRPTENHIMSEMIKKLHYESEQAWKCRTLIVEEPSIEPLTLRVQPPKSVNTILVPFNTLWKREPTVMLVPGTNCSSQSKGQSYHPRYSEDGHNKIKLRLKFKSPASENFKPKRPFQSYVLEKLSNSSYSSKDIEYVLKVHDYNTETIGRCQPSSPQRQMIECAGNSNITDSESECVLLDRHRYHKDTNKIENYSKDILGVPCSHNSNSRPNAATNVSHRKTNVGHVSEYYKYQK